LRAQVTNISEPASSTGNHDNFALDSEVRIFGVYGGVDVAVHALGELERSGHHVWVKRVSHFE
jgi:hypothetical protein